MSLSMRCALPCSAWFLFVVTLQAHIGAAESPAEQATAILQETGVQGGFIVHVGCGDGRLTAALRVNDSYQVQGLSRDAAEVIKARALVSSQGVYGDVAIDRLPGDRLPYIDNLVNLLVVEAAGGISQDEMLRVLVPRGVAYIKQDNSWQKIVKPWPAAIDEWTHYLHAADGNPVAHDDAVGPPRHLQWIGTPRWSRHHDRMASMSAMVSAHGRIFYIMDEGSRVSIQMPPRWMLIARDAFNGTVLWKQPIATWHSHLWPLKSGPTQLARRLVAAGDRVYVTLGLREPISVLDAATGKLIQRIEASHPTEEVILSNGTLVLLVNEGQTENVDFAPAFNTGDQKRVNEGTEFHWNNKPRVLLAVRATDGETLWRQPGVVVAPLTITADGERLFHHDGEKLVCSNLQSGHEIWHSEAAPRRTSLATNFGPRLVVHDGVLLHAGGERTMQAYEAATGKVLWTAPHARGGYQSPEDLLVSGGLVWSAPTISGRDSGIWTGRDLRTGEVKNEFPPNIDTYWFHHRCYIAKATDKFIIPSRTGIEFVDTAKQDWDINHWVRGGCLYGVMPCNGLLYAPPHDCACYPEAKLFGLNALAGANPNREAPAKVSDGERLEKGAAYEALAAALPATTATDDWPTYRHDSSRSGFSATTIPGQLQPAWRTALSGRLSSVVVADGKLFVAEVDRHTIHALDAQTGAKVWSYICGGRVDSPPTIYNGRVIFGSADGWLYCLRAADGELAWRFRAAPRDERLMAMEQLESVWPIHGSVLVENDVAYFVAGRSSFLDGGMRFFLVHVETGRKIAEGMMDDRDPATGLDLQTRLQVLQMPVALPDILSSDNVYVYLKSQQFDLEGNRLAIGPNSGDFAGQGSVQRGETAHLFAPMGFLDDEWFHRSYWVFGRSFAGGHAGYYQAGKFTPAGRLLVFDDKDVYGYGRKPEYLKWTTTMEHQLFASSKEPPPQATSEAETKKGGGAGAAADNAASITFAKSNSLDPTNKPLTVEAWFSADRPDGAIVSHGGPANGYALVLEGGKPSFVVRSTSTASTLRSRIETLGTWVHVAGVLADDLSMRLFINGQLASSGKAAALVAANPAQTLEVGADSAGAVGDYATPFGFSGSIDEVRIYHAALTSEEIIAHAESRERSPADDARLVLALTFEGGTADDATKHANHGTLAGARSDVGKFGRGMQFTFRQARAAAGTFVQYHWTKDQPLMVRAMVKAGDTLFIAGPPDLIDEEESFQRLMSRDPRIAEKLAEQDAALSGKLGGLLRAISARDGSTLAEYKLDALPAWDGMAAATGRLYLSTTANEVVCFSARQ